MRSIPPRSGGLRCDRVTHLALRFLTFLVLLGCSLLEQPPRQFGTAAATRQYGLSWPAPLFAALSAHLLRYSNGGAAPSLTEPLIP